MATMKTARKPAATVIIVLASYVWKHEAKVCFTIKSTDGSQKYNTCFTNGRGACSCDGNAVWHKECKHIKALAPIAAEKLAARDAKAERQAEDEAAMAELTAEMEAEQASIEPAAAGYIPQYKMAGKWYSFQSRGQDVCFDNEPAAAEYLRGVAGETRIERQAADPWAGLSESERRAAYEAMFDPCGLSI